MKLKQEESEQGSMLERRKDTQSPLLFCTYVEYSRKKAGWPWQRAMAEVSLLYGAQLNHHIWQQLPPYPSNAPMNPFIIRTEFMIPLKPKNGSNAATLSQQPSKSPPPPPSAMLLYCHGRESGTIPDSNWGQRHHHLLNCEDEIWASGIDWWIELPPSIGWN